MIYILPGKCGSVWLKRNTWMGITRCNVCLTCSTNSSKWDFFCCTCDSLWSLFHHYIFHALLMMPFTYVQTSVAVISPSKAKSVCSLSVCFHKQTKIIPRGKQRKWQKPNMLTLGNAFIVNREFSLPQMEQMEMPQFSVSYTLSDNTTDKVSKKIKEKSKRKVSKPNRLRGSLNLRTVTLKC